MKTELALVLLSIWETHMLIADLSVYLTPNVIRTKLAFVMNAWILASELAVRMPFVKSSIMSLFAVVLRICPGIPSWVVIP